jgi:hypothetical protein
MLMSSIIVTSPRTSCAAVNTSSHPRVFECVICAAPFADADEQHHRDLPRTSCAAANTNIAAAYKGCLRTV